MKFHGQIQSGALVFRAYQFALRQKYIGKLKEGQRVVEEIKKDLPAKTLEQLGYYYAVILPTVHKQLVADGHEIWGVPISEDMADKILKDQCARLGGAKVVNKRDMDIQQASQFITACIEWANEMLGCAIPPPYKK